MKTGDKTGGVVGALTVMDTDELVLTTNKGKTVRTRVSEIRETGRNTMGVKFIDLDRREKLQDIARVVSQGSDEEATAMRPLPPADGGRRRRGNDPDDDRPATDEATDEDAPRIE